MTRSSSTSGAKRPRICVIRHHYYPQDPRVRREVEALAEGGYNVDILCIGRPGDPPRERREPIEVHRLKLTHRRSGPARYLFEYSVFFLWAFAKVSRLHAKRRYSVVQVNTMPDALVFAAALPKLLGASVILDMHEVMPELYVSKFGENHVAVRLIAFVERLSASFADLVLTVSKPTWRVLVNRGIPPSKLEIVMNTADERIFTSSDGARAQTHSPNSGLTLVSHGVLIERYGYQTIVRALAEIRESHPHVRLLIMGQGEYEPPLRELVHELGLDKNVVFLGFKPLEEVVRVLRRSDIGVTANTNDIFTQLIVPTKLLEYVALAVPAVVSRLPAVEEYFDDSMVNFFAPDDAKDLASVVSSLAEDLCMAREIARRTRDRFLSEYGWTKMRRRYVQLVDELADAPS
jgi:glycosyltransferase involved in cell wall biosynthesis